MAPVEAYIWSLFFLLKLTVSLRVKISLKGFLGKKVKSKQTEIRKKFKAKYTQ